eukprot:TRINITY_DN109570_c0_g1_i1.p3 TRINITY_DN109570_c0_g1~~TRINITY_DN109570_c0_g1_i1.p3  ORF type:complete len:111 (+),score=16.88 TRINITY_DN109570_c0_g1_i1:24-356(+)
MRCNDIGLGDRCIDGSNDEGAIGFNDCNMMFSEVSRAAIDESIRSGCGNGKCDAELFVTIGASRVDKLMWSGGGSVGGAPGLLDAAGDNAHFVDLSVHDLCSLRVRDILD